MKRNSKKTNEIKQNDEASIKMPTNKNKFSNHMVTRRTGKYFPITDIRYHLIFFPFYPNLITNFICEFLKFL